MTHCASLSLPPPRTPAFREAEAIATDGTPLFLLLVVSAVLFTALAFVLIR